jgi:septum formation protein
MLTQLGDRWHAVITAIALVHTGPAGRIETAHALSRVYMRAMSPEARSAYIASGEPMDKAGAYAIQGQAGAYVETIEGSYENIVGLPVQLLAEHLPRFLG